MPKRSRKPLSDPDRAALTTVERDNADEVDIQDQVDEASKDPAAVALGRRGGLKGGPARKAALTPEQRQEAARKAAQARWGKR